LIKLEKKTVPQRRKGNNVVNWMEEKHPAILRGRKVVPEKKNPKQLQEHQAGHRQKTAQSKGRLGDR